MKLSDERRNQIIEESKQAIKCLEALNDYETLYQDCERYLNDLLMKEKIEKKRREKKL